MRGSSRQRWGNAGVGAIDAWCADERVRCAYLLVEAADQATCDIAQAGGFRLVDVRLTFQAPTRGEAFQGSKVPLVRTVRPSDVPNLESITRVSHRDTLFYVDGGFERERCDDLYACWIARSCSGWADQVFVVEMRGVPRGYLTCHLGGDAGRIGLVAVDAASRGRGCASALLDAAHRWFADQRTERVSVVTQARNTAALRLYERARLSLASVQLWFHKWFE